MLLIGRSAFATVDLGVGVNSATSGRVVPGLAGAVGTSEWIVSGTSTGVRNAYYYHSAYSLAVMKIFKVGDLFWGPITAGAGMGAVYTLDGFQDEGSSSEDTNTSASAGFAFKVKWNFAGPVYMNMEGIYGIRDPLTHLTSLTFQDFVSFSVGIGI